MKKIKYYQVAIEGIDKTGKDTVMNYVLSLEKGKFICRTRGLISNIVYSKLYNRDYNFDTSILQNVLYVYLTVDKEDWNIRCKLTNEPKIDYDTHKKLFDEVINQFKNENKSVLEFNTSHITPYEIAKNIIKKLNELNEE